MPEITDPGFLSELNGGAPTAPQAPSGQPRVIYQAPMSPQQQADIQRSQMSIYRDSATLPADISKTQADAANAMRRPSIEDRDDRRKLADDYHADPVVKNYEAALPVYIAGLQTAPTPQGDNSLIYSYAKVMDPGSVVREGEAAAIANSQPYFESTVTNLQKQLTGEGGSFSERTRQRLRLEMRRRLHEMVGGYNLKRRDYRDTAERYGYNEREIIGTHLGDQYRNAERAFIDSLPELQGARAGAAAGARAGDILTPERASPTSAPLQTPDLRPSGTDEVRVPLLDGGDGRTSAQTAQDALAAEVQQLLIDGASKQQLDEYVTRRGREMGALFPPFSQWVNADAVIKARDAGQQFQVGSPKIPYQRSEARGTDEREPPAPITAAVSNLVNPGGAILDAAGAGIDALGGDGARDTTDAFGRGVRSGVSVGWDDEISALLRTAYEGGATDFAQRYDQNVGEERATDAYDEENNFGARLTGQLVGSAVLPTRVPNAGAAAARVSFRDAFAAARARGLGVAEARAEARALATRAGRVGAARQAGIEGAATGAAFGAGNANGDIGDRAGGALAGGALGGVLGYGITRTAPEVGSALSAFAGRTTDDLLDVATRLGVRPTPATVGGKGTAIKQAAMGNTPGAAGPIRNAAERESEDLGAAARRVADSYGKVETPEGAGRALIQGARAFEKATGKRATQLYERRTALMGGEDAPVIMGNTQRAFDKLKFEFPSFPIMADLLNHPAVKKIGESVPGNLELRLREATEALSYIRFVHRNALASKTIPKQVSRRIKQFEQGIEDDVISAARVADRIAGRPAGSGAEAAQRTADRFYARRASSLEREFKRPLAAAKDDINTAPESVYRQLLSDADEVSGNFGRLAATFRGLPKGAQRTFRATALDDMGRAINSQQNAAGDRWSFNTFMTNWAKKSDRAKRLMFGDDAKELNDLVRYAEKLNTIYKTTHNFSGTAQNVTTGTYLLSIPATFATTGSAKATAAVAAIYPTLAAAGSAWVRTPVLRQWMRATMKQAAAGNIGAVSTLVDRLPRIAARNPAVAADIDAIQRAIANFANDNVGSRVAASPENGEGQNQ